MSKLRIKNFGPIKEGYLDNDGWMDISKITLFVGNQGSGKSTIAKAYSTLIWLEKALNRGDIEGVSFYSFKDLFEYQRIRSYFKEDTIIEYQGDLIEMSYNPQLNKKPILNLVKEKDFKVPQIMYVPAERNFLSVVKNAYGLSNLPDSLYTFAEELKKGQIELQKKQIKLPISNMQYRYDSKKEISYIIGDDYELNLLESSSGFQSYVPLYLVTKFLTDKILSNGIDLKRKLSVEQSIRRTDAINSVMYDETLSDSEKVQKVKEIDAKYLNSCLINIVEEPEQNLYPTSQMQMLFNLFEFNNQIDANKLVLTTHSPYLINFLTLAVKAGMLKEQISDNKILQKLNKIVPLKATVKPEDVSIYQFNERTGTIEKLETYEGIPSDENHLNEKLGETNELFAQLLEIEEMI